MKTKGILRRLKSKWRFSPPTKRQKLCFLICLVVVVAQNARFCLSKLGRAFYTATSVGQAKGSHITRYEMYRHLEKTFHQKRNSKAKVLTISHSQPLAKKFGYDASQIFDAAYPKYNLLKLPFRDGEFDAVFSDQVLEHIEGDPRQAFSESFRVVKPGGWVVHTTCLLNPIHSSPGDFWRFTPSGLKLLASQFGNVIESGGWGNRAVWFIDWLGLRYAAISHNRFNPFHQLATMNNPDWPIVTWVVAIKQTK